MVPAPVVAAFQPIGAQDLDQLVEIEVAAGKGQLQQAVLIHRDAQRHRRHGLHRAPHEALAVQDVRDPGKLLHAVAQEVVSAFLLRLHEAPVLGPEAPALQKRENRPLRFRVPDQGRRFRRGRLFRLRQELCGVEGRLAVAEGQLDGHAVPQIVDACFRLQRQHLVTLGEGMVHADLGGFFHLRQHQREKIRHARFVHFDPRPVGKYLRQLPEGLSRLRRHMADPHVVQHPLALLRQRQQNPVRSYRDAPVSVPVLHAHDDVRRAVRHAARLRAEALHVHRERLALHDPAEPG